MQMRNEIKQRATERNLITNRIPAEKDERRADVPLRGYSPAISCLQCVSRAHALRCALVPKPHQGQALRTGLRKSSDSTASVANGPAPTQARVSFAVYRSPIFVDRRRHVATGKRSFKSSRGHASPLLLSERSFALLRASPPPYQIARRMIIPIGERSCERVRCHLQSATILDDLPRILERYRAAIAPESARVHVGFHHANKDFH